MSKHILTFWLCIFLSSLVFGEGISKQDSLKQLLRIAPDDTAKVWLFHEVARSFHTNNQDSTLFYLQPAMDLSRRIGFNRGEAASLARLISTYFMTGDKEKYEQLIRQIPSISEKPDLGNFKGKILLRMANYYEQRLTYDSAFYYFRLAEQAHIENENTYNNWVIYFDMGRSYNVLENIPARDEYLKKAYDITYEKQVRKDHGFMLYQMMKYAYLDNRFADYASYLDEYRQLIQKDKKDSDDMLVHPFNFSSPDEPKAVQLEKQLGILQEQKRMNHTQSLLSTTLEVAYLKGEVGDFNGGIQYALEGLETSEAASRVYLQVDFLKQLADLYEKKGNFEQALAYNKKTTNLTDSLHIKESQKNLQELEIKYQTEKQEKELAASRFALEKTSIQNRNLIIIAVLVGILALVALWFLYFKSKTNALLGQKNKAIAKSLEEKETLLREIHHRVKNNLQVVSSLLSLQSDTIQDVEAQKAFQEGQDRVYSMALIHQNLYQTDNLTSMDIKDYIEKLANSLYQSYQVKQENIDLSIHADSLLIDVDTLIPIGLILNELLSNALKHAFPDGQEGKIEVVFKQESEALFLSVKDDGIGLPETYKDLKSNTFGMTLIQSFAKKLEAEFFAESKMGTSLNLRIHKYRIAS